MRTRLNLGLDAGIETGAAFAPPVVAVILPCFRVAKEAVKLIGRIGPECHLIYVVDDACPDGSGEAVASQQSDPRVRILSHDRNQGVGGAMVTGFRAALAEGADIVVKLDGDGQMDPALIPNFLQPIMDGRADYAKGNRFFNIEDVKSMPASRLFGNIVLSFMAKASSGYWSNFDPNNGYVAIDARLLRHIPLEKLAKRYFFESDMLFRLNVMRARVIDVPMKAVYGSEPSSLKPLRVIPSFVGLHLVNACKRIFYNYFLRDFSIASLELLVGLALLLFGGIFGLTTWIGNNQAGVLTSTGTVMLAVLPTIVGIQLLLAFMNFEMSNVPTEPMSPLLTDRKGDAKCR